MRRRDVLPLLVIVVAVCAFNYPLLLNLESHIFGRSFEDTFEVLWQLRWHEHALRDPTLSPFFTPNIYYPMGWHLATGAQPAWYLLLLAPFVSLFGAVSVYNASLLLLLIIAAFGVYHLLNEIVTSRIGGVFAGLGYAFAPVLTIRFAGHWHTLVAAALLPYVYLNILRAIGATTPRKARQLALRAGIFLALTMLAHWYFLFIATLPLVGWLLWRRCWSWQGLQTFIISGGLAMLIIAPFAVMTYRARLVSYEASPQWTVADVDGNSAEIPRFFTPNPNNPIWRDALQVYLPLRGEASVISIGSGLLLLMIVGIWKGRTELRWVFVAVAAVAFMLAIGTNLSWNGSSVPLPSGLLFKWLPFYSSVRVLARYAIVLQLAVVVVAGLGIHYLHHRRIILLLLLSMILVESFSLPYHDFTPVAQNDRPMLNAFLRSQPVTTSLIEFPVVYVDKLAVYSESFHHRRVVNGYQSFAPTHYADALMQLGTWPTEESLTLLREWDVDFVVVSGDESAEFATIIAAVKEIAGLCHIVTFDEGFMNYTQTYLFSLSNCS